MKGALSLNGLVVTLELTCDDHYEAISLHDKILEGVKAGNVSLSFTVENPPIKDDPPIKLSR